MTTNTKESGIIPNFEALKQKRNEQELCLLNNLISFTSGKDESEKTAELIFKKYECISNLLNHPLMLDRITSLQTENSTACLLALCALAFTNEDSVTKAKAKKPLNSLEALASCTANMYRNAKNEAISLLFVNEKMELVNSSVLTSNHVSYARLKIRDILIAKPDLQSCGLFLVHNHPNGPATPSQADIDAFNNLKKRLIGYGIAVLDSLIVAQNTIYSVANCRAIEV
ncbi:MAG: JAB domain-containing protein [Clostridiales bacterium]|nr:JAB domain-containing protein [Clostridiales bacterium]